MGRQVGFYMMPADEEDFIRYVRSDRDVGIFMHAFPTAEIPLLEGLPNPGEPFWYALWLWDRGHSPRPVVRYVPQQQYHVVDPFGSEVIEFSRCPMDEGRLVRGRIWAEMSACRADAPGKTFVKSESFQQWFDGLANWIKRRSVRDEIGDCLLPGAQAFVKAGGKSIQAVFDTNVRFHRYDPGLG